MMHAADSTNNTNAKVEVHPFLCEFFQDNYSHNFSCEFNKFRVDTHLRKLRKNTRVTRF